jgi:hypothetical protein
MNFSIYKDGELSDIVQVYNEGIPGSMIINESGKVEWFLMMEQSSHHHYKGKACTT